MNFEGGTNLSLKNIAVIGSGLMGHGIAQVVAMSGQEVSLIDISNELLAKAIVKINESLTKLSVKGKIAENPDHILKRIKTTTNLRNGVNSADYVIEAVPEDIQLKRKIISEVDSYAPEHAILATNTSGLSITAIAEATGRKDRVIGMHWMNPPQVMKLVEIIASKYTDDDVLQSTLELCRRYDKETVTAKKDVWFFLAARARAGWSIECNLMYLRGEATAGEIDAIARHKFRLPMGEFELMDFTGAVDIRPSGVKSTEQIMKTYPQFEPWPILLSVYKYLSQELWQPMGEKKLSGVKTGKGFYEYPEGKYAKPAIPQELAEKIEPTQPIAPAANVAAWCVTNKVGSIEDVNKAFRLAFGWPKGIFEYVDEYGVDSILATLAAKEQKAPHWLRDFYVSDPLLIGWKS